MWFGGINPLLFFTLMISSNKIPKLRTSDFVENSPLKAYSSTMKPLQDITSFKQERLIRKESKFTLKYGQEVDTIDEEAA